MKIKVTLALVLVALLAVGASLFISRTKTPEGKKNAAESASKTTAIRWYGYDEGMALGRKEGKKILIHFYADWCHYCQLMDRETFSQSDVAAYMNRNFISIKLNTDTEKQLAEQYRVTGLPTTWFLESDGSKILSLPGYLPKVMFIGLMKYINTDSYRRMSFKTFMTAQ